MKHFFTKALACASLAALLALPAGAMAEAVAMSGLTTGGTAQQLGAPASYGSETVTMTMPQENPVVEGVNPITGLPYTGEYQPILVSIDASPAALPHWGASAADLIYEMPIQADGSTRSLAVFMGDIPEGAGPVRSARVPMTSLHEIWGGTLCYYGLQEGEDSNNVRKWVKANSANPKHAYPWYLNALAKHNGWFPRHTDADHKAPHNARLLIGNVKADYQLTPAPHPFIFGDGLSVDRGEAVNGIVISPREDQNYLSAYQYNAATGTYDRYRDGAPYVDGNNGAACTYANVIVMRTDVRWNSGNPSRPVIRLHGEGVAEIFQNGRYIRGTWARESDGKTGLTNRIVYFDENGQELVMKPGKTFIQIVKNEQPVIVLSDDAIEGAASL